MRRHQRIDMRKKEGALHNNPSDLGPSDLWSHLRSQRQKTPQVAWRRKRGQVTCKITWPNISDEKWAQIQMSFLHYVFCYRNHRRVQLVIVNTRVALIRCVSCRDIVCPKNKRTQRLLIRPFSTWWRHQMETLSALLALCAFSGHRWIPLTKASDAELWFFFFDLRLNKRLGKKSKRCWVETPRRSLWRHCNDINECPVAFKMFLTILNTTGIPSYLFT